VQSLVESLVEFRGNFQECTPAIHVRGKQKGSLRIVEFYWMGPTMLAMLEAAWLSLLPTVESAWRTPSTMCVSMLVCFI
jgi:hypothetical protein